MINFKKLIIHIGAEKTGTTSIQELLHDNRKELLSSGTYYPRSIGIKNHTSLAKYAIKMARCRQQMQITGLGGHEDLDACNEIKKAHDLELSSVPNNCHTIIYSNEHLQSQLKSELELRIFKEFLPPSQEIKIILYVRRQDRAAVSRYFTALKAGVVSSFTFPTISNQRLPWSYDYLRAYYLWSKVFGAESVVVRVFDKSRFVDENLYKDFFFAAGMEWNSDLVSPLNQNISPDRMGLKLMANINSLFATQNINPKHLKTIRNEISRKFVSGERFKPERTSAIEFYSAFLKSNQELCCLINDISHDKLFDDDFSDYPDTDIINYTSSEWEKMNEYLIQSLIITLNV
jgi:hypothetical protein